MKTERIVTAAPHIVAMAAATPQERAAAAVPALRRGAHAFPFSKPAGFKVLYGVGCQIRRQAGHGAAHRLAT